MAIEALGVNNTDMEIRGGLQYVAITTWADASAVTFDDSDDTACDAIRYVAKQTPRNSEIIFANGGDRKKGTTPEVEFARELRDECNISFAFGVGGEDKKNSSSWILKEWDKPTTDRLWGKYRDLDQNGHWKVKELSIDVGKSLSDQRHFIRSEHWHIVDGSLKMNLEFFTMFTCHLLACIIRTEL